jgi:hypothetical protein
LYNPASGQDIKGGTMLKLLVKSGLAGAAVLFVWGFFSWVVLPWHTMTLNAFSNEDALAQAVMDGTSKTGIHILPDPKAHNDPATKEKMKTGPIVFSAVTRHGVEGMGLQLALSFGIQFLAAVLASWLLLQANIADYKKRVAFLTVTALVGGVASHLPYWNWWGFPCAYTLVQLADLAVGWALAGLAMGKIIKA